MLHWVRMPAASLVIGASLLIQGCSPPDKLSKTVYEMGDRVVVGPLTYTVIETDTKNQLGEFPNVRVPQRNFLLVRISVTNGAGAEVALPFLNIENSTGESFSELSDGTSVDHWFGLLRKIGPSQTEQGWILFDVPTNSYKLRVTDAAESGKERTALINIPLKLS